MPSTVPYLVKFYVTLRYKLSPSFLVGENESQRNEVICLKSPSQEIVEPGFESMVCLTLESMCIIIVKFQVFATPYIKKHLDSMVCHNRRK